MKKGILKICTIFMLISFIFSIAIMPSADVFTSGMSVVNRLLTEPLPVDKLTQKEALLYSEDSGYSFTDISGHWAQESMEELGNMDILKGFTDGTMRPQRTLTRAEFITMVVRAVGIPTNGTYSQYYRDVAKTSWEYTYVSVAKYSGLLDIYSGSYLYPTKTITREEMAAIAAKVVATAPLVGPERSFKDISSTYKYLDRIKRVTSLGIINGLPDNTFRPKGSASRAEAAAIISRILKVREPLNEQGTDTLKNLALRYEKALIQSANAGDAAMSDAFYLSAGREKAQNNLRVQTIKSLYQRGANSRRYISDTSMLLLSKSRYAAKVRMSYTMTVEANDFTAKQYRVIKEFYLKNIGGRWGVYNAIPKFEYAGSIDRTKKLNMTWQYMYMSSPDMSNVPKNETLDIISPTWFTLISPGGDILNKASIAYSDWAHKNGYKVWALISNEFESEMTSKMLNDPAARAKAIDTIINYARQYKVDGLNIDFENMYVKDKYIFTQFVKEFTDKAKPHGFVVSVDVTVITESNWSGCYDRAALAEIVDYIGLMTYDQHWKGSSAGSVAQLSWVDMSVQKVLNEVPAHKLLLGLPFYTREWKEVYTPGTTKPTTTSRAISMGEAEQIVAANNATKVWDAVSGQYYATYQKDGATYKIWMEEEQSIRLKTELVNKYNLAGVASWQMGLEKPIVWNVIDEVLRKGESGF